ncbi:PilC family type IV pilus tip adhesin [Neisseria dumasiana]|uniref:PilC family type IV pilus tip adhesin n=1 Tax=Neisseria dumasiana TaxID=1931275 RepID=UPI000A19A07F|nr:PilC family type IV pilus tip adhesin [Neisseria dumasiana]OSI17354.1 hypothetical protein BV914_01030 [Neisseria dumasiana]
MKKSAPRLNTAVRPIIYSLLAAFPLLAANPSSAQFADTPLHLQQQTTISGGAGKVKPNVMLFIDDSGSMDWAPAGRNQPGRKRIEITKDALSAVINKYGSKVNWSLQTLHNNNNANLSGYTDQPHTILQHISRLSPDHGTPTTRRYYEISKDVRKNTLYRCQKNYIVLMSDGDANLSCSTPSFNWNPWAPSVPSKLTFTYPSAQFPDEQNYFGNVDSRGTCEYSQASTGHYHTFWDRNKGLQFFSRTLASKDFKTSGTDLAGKSWNGDPADPKGPDGQSIYAKQTAQTFTVGFGEDLTREGKAYLQNGATRPEWFFDASNEEKLVAAFDTIFNDIENSSLNNAEEGAGTAAPAVTGNHTSGTPNTAVSVYLDPQSWSSQLRFYNINTAGRVDTAFKLPYFGERKTLISTGKADSSGKSVFWANNVSHLNNADFGINNPSKASEWSSSLLPWTIRSKDDAQIKADTQNSQVYRNRNLDAQGKAVSGKRDLGDILDSGIAIIGDTDGSNQHHQEFLLTAANDGMVHLFQRVPQVNHPYSLKLSYIPAGMERDSGNGGETLGKTLKEVAQEGYGAAHPHRYMVNGGFVVRRTPASRNPAVKGQQIVMFGAMGQGGRGAYALNIGGKDRVTGQGIGLSNNTPASWDSSVPLFETEKGVNNTLGYTVGTPQIGRVSLERIPGQQVKTNEKVSYGAFLSSGYRKQDINDKSNETALYIYDLLGQEASTGEKNGNKAGSLIKKITVPNGIGGLSSPTVLDTDFDGIIDVAYAGDYGGSMYRFDLRGQTPNNWQVHKIYQGSPSQPITAAPAVSRRGINRYVVIFGTGSDIYQSDLKDTRQQAIYGIFEDLTPPKDNSPSQAPNTVTNAELLEQTITLKEVEGNPYRFLSNNLIQPTHKGWKINLGSTDGERVVVKPSMILRTAVFSTRIYKATETRSSNGGDLCIPDKTETSTESKSWILAVNAETGGGLKQGDARLNFLNKVVQTGGYYANGQQKSGIVSFTYIDPVQLAKNSPVTADGDSGGSGTDAEVDGEGRPVNRSTPKNQCFAKKADRSLITNQGESISVAGRNCGIRRISWREIF